MAFFCYQKPTKAAVFSTKDSITISKLRNFISNQLTLQSSPESVAATGSTHSSSTGLIPTSTPTSVLVFASVLSFVLALSAL